MIQTVSELTTETAAVVRELPETEWTRLATFEPFRSGGLPQAGHWRMIVAERGGAGGQIVAFSCVYVACHCEPTWIAEDFRHRPKLLLELWRGVRRVLDELGAPMVFATALPETSIVWQKLGFVKSPNDLLVGRLDEMLK